MHRNTVLFHGHVTVWQLSGQTPPTPQYLWSLLVFSVSWLCLRDSRWAGWVKPRPACAMLFDCSYTHLSSDFSVNSQWACDSLIFIFITVIDMHEMCVCSFSLQWWELLVFLWSHLSPTPSSARWLRARPGCPVATKCRWGKKWCRSPGSSSSQMAPKTKLSLPTLWRARQVDCSVCVGLYVCFVCTVRTTGVTSHALQGHRFITRLAFHLFDCQKWLQSFQQVFVFRKQRLKTTGKYWLYFLQLLNSITSAIQSSTAAVLNWWSLKSHIFSWSCSRDPNLSC